MAGGYSKAEVDGIIQRIKEEVYSGRLYMQHAQKHRAGGGDPLPSGTGTFAAASDAFVTIGNPADLGSSRALTAGSGIDVADGGAGTTVTVAWGDLLADYVEAGNLAGVYFTEWFKGHFAVGSAAPNANTILAVADTITPSGGIVNAVNGSMITSPTADNSFSINGLNYTVSLSGDGVAHNQTGIVSGIQSLIQTINGANLTVSDIRNLFARLIIAATNTVTARYGLYIQNASGAGTLTNQTGLYIEALTKGGTLNIAIRALGGHSRHVGSLKLGADSTPTEILDVTGNAAIKADNQLKLYDADDSNFIGLRADSARTTDLVYVLPATDPTVGQVLSASAPVAGVVTLSWTTAGSGSRMLTWYADQPVAGALGPLLPVQFNGSAATAISPIRVRAEDYGYGTMTINVLKATNTLPNPSFATILTSDLTVEASHVCCSGVESVAISGGAISTTAFADDDLLRQDYDSMAGALGVTVELTLTTP